MQEIMKRAAQVKLVIFDVDGVLTDGRLYVGDSEVGYKAFHARDGLGMKLLQNTGVEIGIITGLKSDIVKRRMAALGIKHVFQGCEEKFPAYAQLCQQLGLSFEETAYVGDDIIDLPVMLKVGLAVSVADAHPLVAVHSHWQTSKDGGCGAAREVCELIMQAQNTWQQQLSPYLPLEYQ